MAHLTSQELATVVAGLRSFQALTEERDYQEGGPLADLFRTVVPLDDAAINALVARLTTEAGRAPVDVDGLVEAVAEAHRRLGEYQMGSDDTGRGGALAALEREAEDAIDALLDALREGGAAPVTVSELTFDRDASYDMGVARYTVVETRDGSSGFGHYGVTVSDLHLGLDADAEREVPGRIRVTVVAVEEAGS